MSTSGTRAEDSARDKTDGGSFDSPTPVPTGIAVTVAAAIAYVPLLLTQPGQVGADTKSYLYLNPSRLLADAPYLWDSGIGTGSVTHQNIGYLWPMGPFYWVLETIGSPDWVAQRLWLGTVLFGAALGVRYLLRTLGWRDAAASHGVLVASLAYMLSPYILDYAARISVILLPFVGLPWLLALTIRSLRRGGWWYPAAFALVALTVGGTNATALVMIAPAPALWCLYATLIEREISVGRMFATVGRIAALGLATSLWWMAGLWAQGSHGLPVLRFTETYKTVADAALAPEMFRGLGYWFFYGEDKLGAWIEPSVSYTTRVPLAISYAVPVLALISAVAVRWRHRAFFLVVTGVGVLMSVGSHPWDDSSPLGALFKEFTRTDAGLALRSTPRSVPLVALGIAVLLGSGVVGLARRIQPRAIAISAMAVVLVVANLSPLWTGSMVAENLKRDEDLPEYWLEATAALEADPSTAATRVLELPGSDFASYRWGNTVDPITPGLIDRPYVARELFLYGTPASAALLVSLDRQLQEGRLAPESLAPVARLLGIGDVLHRADLQFERFRSARPEPTQQLLLETPGLSDPLDFGEGVPNDPGPEQTMIDEAELGGNQDLPAVSALSLFTVEDALPILRLKPSANPLIVAGGPEGIVNGAAVGAVDPRQAIFYAATFVDEPDGLDALLADGADLLVTDTNRKRATRWGTLQENTGYTERAGEEPGSYDPTDQRLLVFEDAPDSAYTLSEQRGGLTATASAYGNPVTYTPDDRPANAVDGNLETAWRVGAFSDVTGEQLKLAFDEPVTAEAIRVAQPQGGVANRSITEIDLVFDGDERERVALDPANTPPDGETVDFEERTFTDLTIEIVTTDAGRRDEYGGLSGVGFTEVSVADIVMEEIIVVPPTLLDAVGQASIDHRLDIVLTRLRTDPALAVRGDEEPALRRAFDLPVGRDFSLDTEIRLTRNAGDELIDAVLGVEGPEQGGIAARASGRLPGSPRHRASAAVDGDLSTYWSTPLARVPESRWIELTLPEKTTLDTLDLAIITDGRHTVPEQLIISSESGETRTVDIPTLEDSTEIDAVSETTVEFESIEAGVVTIAIGDVRDVLAPDWFGGGEVSLPVGLAEIGLPGHDPEPISEVFSAGCREDLLSIDGDPVPLRVSGTVEAALTGRPLEVEECSAGVDLDRGEHIVRSTPGTETGFDVDRVTLASSAGGAASDRDDAVLDHETPTITTVDGGRVKTSVEIEGGVEPFWLVLGESHSPGFEARVDGVGALDEPVLIDGYANGWYIDPEVVGADPMITIEWMPQRAIWIGLALSALGVAACLAIIVAGWRARTRNLPIERDEPAIRASVSAPVAWSARASLLTGIAVGLAAVLNLSPPGFAAVAVGAIAYLAFRYRWGAHIPGFLAATCLAVSSLFIVLSQVMFRHRPGFAWPQEFEAVHVLGVVCALLLVVEAVREFAGRPARHDSPGHEVRTSYALEIDEAPERPMEK